MWVVVSLISVTTAPIVIRNPVVTKDVFFFNFALRDGHFMARPIFNPQQSLVGEIIHSLERFNPRFAWIQFLFSRRDYNHLLMHTKAELESYVQLANTSQYDTRSSQKIPRKELKTQWYKLAQARIKKIEQMLSKPTVIFAINGMWVSNEGNVSSSIHQIQELPLSLSSDDTDRLRAFVYRDPRILGMLIERRMVTDISASIYSYSQSREEPPSLIFGPDEIPYYVHMPAGTSAKGLSSIRAAAHLPVGGTLNAEEVAREEGNETSKPYYLAQSMNPENESPTNQATTWFKRQPEKGGECADGIEKRKRPLVASLNKLPTLEQPLDEEEAQRLSQIASRNVRTFEVLYESQNDSKQSGITQVLLSSSCETSGDDLEKIYIPQLESIYGKLEYTIISDNKPAFVASLANLMKV